MLNTLCHATSSRARGLSAGGQKPLGRSLIRLCPPNLCKQEVLNKHSLNGGLYRWIKRRGQWLITTQEVRAGFMEVDLYTEIRKRSRLSLSFCMYRNTAIFFSYHLCGSQENITCKKKKKISRVLWWGPLPKEREKKGEKTSR